MEEFAVHWCFAAKALKRSNALRFSVFSVAPHPDCKFKVTDLSCRRLLLLKTPKKIRCLCKTITCF